MTPRELHLIAPGPLDQRTGGYLYNARIVEGLTALGWRVIAHALEGRFPEGDAVAEASLARTLEGIPQGARVVLDGLAMSPLPNPRRAHRDRLRLIALIHHPLADETGLSLDQRERFAALEREALTACLGVLVTSDFTARRLAAFGVPAARVRAVVPQGVSRAHGQTSPNFHGSHLLLRGAARGQQLLVPQPSQLQLPGCHGVARAWA